MAVSGSGFSVGADGSGSGADGAGYVAGSGVITLDKSSTTDNTIELSAGALKSEDGVSNVKITITLDDDGTEKFTVTYGA